MPNRAERKEIMSNVKKEAMAVRVMKSRFFKAAFAVYMFFYGMYLNMYCCFAGDTDAKELEEQVLNPMNILLNVILSGVSIFGVIYLVKSLGDLNEAIGAQDNSGIWRSAKGIIAAILFIAIKFLVKLFGYEG